MVKKLLLGNEAAAIGARDAGVFFASAYPGTPSTEITECIARFNDIVSEWAPNEKVALEAGMGASVAGGRAVVTMKHVGVNVAADPLFTASYTGVNAGLVLIVGDDPGMHSSQNEQDTKFMARGALLPILEPSDSQEVYDFVRMAFDISEKYDRPAIVRLTTRIAHSRTLVQTGTPRSREKLPYTKNPQKYVMMPAMAKQRHKAILASMSALTEDIPLLGVNRVEHGSDIGVVTSSMCYQYVKEALPDVSVLKLGMTYPLNRNEIAAFASSVSKLYVVEELEGFIEDSIKAIGIPCEGKSLFPRDGELSVHLVAEALGGSASKACYKSDTALPPRPPVMCPGCPHRGTYYALTKLGFTVTGDIGCYTLGALKPLEALDTSLCMGASIGMAHGMEKVMGREAARNIAAVIGDSTFIHSGITGLIEAVYNDAHFTVVIMDNSITGMTGHQQNPATGYNIKGDPAAAVDLESLCRSVGVNDVHVVDPFDVKATQEALKSARDYNGMSVVISRRPCALLKSVTRLPALNINSCKNCGMCLKIGCPAIEKLADGMHIDPAVCTGCGLCAGICPFGCIERSKA